jgi:hypothetical protein
MNPGGLLRTGVNCNQNCNQNCKPHGMGACLNDRRSCLRLRRPAHPDCHARLVCPGRDPGPGTRIRP